MNGGPLPAKIRKLIPSSRGHKKSGTKVKMLTQAAKNPSSFCFHGFFFFFFLFWKDKEERVLFKTGVWEETETRRREEEVSGLSFPSRSVGAEDR